MKKKWHVLLILVGILLLVCALPYAKVEILSANADRKLESFDLSCFENVYCEGTPKVYDCKIYAYSKERNAKVFYVLGDCEYGVMVDLEWNDAGQFWELVDGRTMWSIHGGNAQEFCWPLYYGDKVYPLIEN